jgi:hypothetical protein
MIIVGLSTNYGSNFLDLSDSRLKSPEKLFESRHGGEQNDYLVFPSKAGTIKSIAGR